METVPSVIVKSEQGPILWNLALIHFSKDAMSMPIVGQITIDIQQPNDLSVVTQLCWGREVNGRL